MTTRFTGFTAVLDDHDVRPAAKPWLAEIDGVDGLEDTDGRVAALRLTAELDEALFAFVAATAEDDLLIGTVDEGAFASLDYDDALPFEAFDHPQAPPVPGGLDQAVAVFDQSGATIQWIDHMMTLGQDDFLPAPAVADLDAWVMPVLAGEEAERPPVMPTLGEDDVLLGKDADLPVVLPGADGFDPEPPVFNLPSQDLQLFDQGMTLGEDGFLLGPPEDRVLLHYHDDGWLF